MQTQKQDRPHSGRSNRVCEISSFLVIVLNLACFAITTGLPAHAGTKAPSHETLADYVARASLAPPPDFPKPTTGSLWLDSGALANLTSDYKAHHVGDLVQVVIVQDSTASNSGTIATNRSFKASSGITSIAGMTVSQLQNLFSPQSAATLAGKSAAASSLSLRTTLMGQVAAVLPSGAFVIEAQRGTTMNNERQTVLLRGVARPGDIAGDGSVLSTALSGLEVELKGKGVVSDGTRPPSGVIRWLLHVLNF